MPRSKVAFDLLMRNQSVDRGRLWEVSSDLLGILNAEGYFEVTNPAWELALGLTSKTILDTSIFDLIHPDDVDKTRISLQEAAAGPNQCCDSRIGTVGPTANISGCRGPRYGKRASFIAADATLRKNGRCEPSYRRHSTSCASRKKWKPSANSPAASLMTSTIC